MATASADQVSIGVSFPHPSPVFSPFFRRSFVQLEYHKSSLASVKWGVEWLRVHTLLWVAMVRTLIEHCPIRVDYQCLLPLHDCRVHSCKQPSSLPASYLHLIAHLQGHVHRFSIVITTEHSVNLLSESEVGLTTLSQCRLTISVCLYPFWNPIKDFLFLKYSS